ncbi:MAG: 50S ribosome-binding GTPase, partial [Bacteroides sp.]|nr:50S ribosome-binding GTPase [Bacteroides sp.]
EKAIVSDIHGTTRDVIEDTINIGGITFRFIDTAGIRKTNDAIEILGIERTFLKLEQAEIVLWMIDATDAASQISQLSDQILPRCQGKHLILVFNKADLVLDINLSTLSPTHLPDNVQSISLSAKQRIHINELQQMLIAAANLPSVTPNDIIVTNIRHYEALTHALEAIKRVQQGLTDNLSGDLVSQDIRECIFHLSDIAGEVTNDMVLQNIFENFCIGK